MSLIDSASLIVTPNGYKEGKLYSVIPSDGSGDMSVVRATTATRVNSSGLVELVPYNIVQYSEDFSNAAWVKSNATFSVDTLTGNAGTSFKGIFQNQTTQGFQSVFFDVAYSSHQWIQIAVGTTATDVGYVNFDIQNKVVGAQTGGFTGSIVDFGTYVRIIANINTIAKTSVLLCLVNSSSSSRAASTTSTGSIKLYRSQLVEGSVAKDYQKTETRLNIPRLDYSNGTCPSLLVEPQRTNLALYSSSFDNAAWNKTNCSITANNATAPDGTTTADKLILANGQSGSSSDGTGIRQLVDIASGSYTYSIYAKAAEFTTIRFRENQVTGAFLTIDLTNGAITNGDVVQYINPTATLVSNGWYRITFQTPTLTALYKYSVRVSETGNGTSGIFIWGYQVELGSYSTSYIPTTSASVTRNADVISKTGISSLIGQTEGVIFYDFILSTTGVDFTLGNLYSSSNGNSYSLLYINPSNQIGATIINNGSTECEIVTSSLSLGRHKIAFAYKANDFAVYIDGALQGTDTSGSVPAMDSFNMVNFNLAPNAYRQEVNIYSSALWKTRLTNDELERLTGTGFNTYAEMANYYNYITQ